MKYYTSTTQYNCGIDLHAHQMYLCVMDRQGKKLVHTNVKENDFNFFLKLVEKVRARAETPPGTDIASECHTLLEHPPHRHVH